MCILLIVLFFVLIHCLLHFEIVCHRVLYDLSVCINHIKNLNQIKNFATSKNIGRFDLTCSVDCWGPEQEYVRSGLNLELLEEYFSYAADQDESWLWLNVNQTISSMTIKTMPQLIEKIKTASIENKASGGGCFKEGNILMLCDKGPRTNVRASAVVVPFINFLDNDGPSRMLAEALQREKISENQIYWINTQSYLGVGTDPTFVKDLKPHRIFALGNNAYTWALNNNVQAIKLPPPLYHMQNFPNQPYHITEADYGNDN